MHSTDLYESLESSHVHAKVTEFSVVMKCLSVQEHLQVFQYSEYRQ